LPTRIVYTTKDLRYILNIYCRINTWTCGLQCGMFCISE